MTAFGTHGVELSIEAAFGYAPYATPVWTDISKYLYKLSIRRGIQQSVLPGATAGRCTLTLNNNDSRFDPNNTASPYDPDVVVAVPIRIRATYNAATYPLFQGFANSWDVTYPGKGFVSTVTVPCVDGLQLLNQQSLVGSTYDQEKTDTRLGNILDDAGWPAGLRNLDSAIGETGVSVDVGGSAFTHLIAAAAGEAGRIFVAADGDFTFHNRTHHAGGATSEGTFGPADLAYDDIVLRYDDRYLYNDVWVTRRIGADVTIRIETEPATGAAGPSGGPVGNVTITTPEDGESVSVNWSEVLVDGEILRVALVSLPAVTSVTVVSGEGSNNGEIYVPATVIVKDVVPDGLLRVVGEVPVGEEIDIVQSILPGEVSPIVWEPNIVDDVDGTEVPATFTLVQIPASVPVPQNASSSFTDFRQRTVRLSGTAAALDVEALNVAEWLLGVFNTVRTRVEKLVVKPQSDPTNVWPVVLGIDLRDSITVKTDPKGGGDGLTQQVTVDTISHSITLEKWDVTFGCWPLAPVETADYWILGTSNDLDVDTVIA